jgi:hypothetical protein
MFLVRRASPERHATANMGIFLALFIGGLLALGLPAGRAVDQKAGRGYRRAPPLYPMQFHTALPKWMLLIPAWGWHLVRSWGFESFTSTWFDQPEWAIYRVADQPVRGCWLQMKCAVFDAANDPSSCRIAFYYARRASISCIIIPSLPAGVLFSARWMVTSATTS